MNTIVDQHMRECDAARRFDLLEQSFNNSITTLHALRIATEETRARLENLSFTRDDFEDISTRLDRNNDAIVAVDVKVDAATSRLNEIEKVFITAKGMVSFLQWLGGLGAAVLALLQLADWYYKK